MMAFPVLHVSPSIQVVASVPQPALVRQVSVVWETQLVEPQTKHDPFTTNEVSCFIWMIASALGYLGFLDQL